MDEREGMNALIDAAVIVQKLREENDQLREALREIADAPLEVGRDPLVKIARDALGDTEHE